MEPISLPEPGIPAGNSSSVAQEKFHVLLGVTGSVAALKLPLLVAELLKIPGLEVKVVTTERAKHFYNAQEIPVTLYGDEEEWQLWKGRSDPVLHIELRRWADLMVVAPLDANTLAKVANGICDNLLALKIAAWAERCLKVMNGFAMFAKEMLSFDGHQNTWACPSWLEE
ncbi:phosphopantothenoylcysteine decarboxylase isoform X4 [Agelaius tricolor]|uniref:phosphopantothenoylcysteine decarboxylase isoform X4 n=1 Tax=Agelaius tricolor TaxID=9191 RepID=UPI0039F22E73